MLDFIKEIVAIGADIATPLALSGFIVSLVFGIVWFIVSKIDFKGLAQVHLYRILRYIVICWFILGIVAVVAGVGSWILSRYWLHDNLVLQYIGDARSARDEKRYDDMIDAINDGLELDQTSPILLDLRAQFHALSEEDFEMAHRFSMQAYERRPSPAYLVNASYYSFRLSEYSRAEHEIRRAIQAGRNEARHYYALALTLLWQEQFDQARTMLADVANESYPDGIGWRPSAFYQLGISELKERRDEGYGERAVSHFRRAICLDPSFLSVMHLERLHAATNPDILNASLDVLREADDVIEFREFLSEGCPFSLCGSVDYEIN